MTDTPVDILMVEDSVTLALTYETFLRPIDATITRVVSGQEALAALSRSVPDVVILDLKLPDMDGLEILRHIMAQKMPAKVIVITAHGSVQVAVDAMREGATDFVLKPFNAERLVTTTRNALELQRLTQLVARYEKSKPESSFGGFIGESTAMQAIYRMIADAAGSRASVFITGESGTGKEVTAETLHSMGPRRDNPFVALNCAAIPATLIESEIFGHKKGAFTGATEDRPGAAKRAHGGTLFLDELCEMPMELQAKLLRVLQSGQFVPVGGTKTETVDIRIVCATNRVPWEEVRAGRLREDLYYRLHVIPIHLPALHDRGRDVILLAHHFLTVFSREENKQFEGFSPDAEQQLLNYRWPGNVRELSNVIQSAVVLNEGSVVTADMLSDPLGAPTQKSARSGVLETNLASAYSRVVTPPHAEDQAVLPTLADMEAQLIGAAMDRCGGQVSQAAAMLGLHPSTLYRKLERLSEKQAS